MQGGRCESILNGLGTCNAAMGKWSEAGKELQEGLEMVSLFFSFFSAFHTSSYVLALLIAS